MEAKKREGKVDSAGDVNLFDDSSDGSDSEADWEEYQTILRSHGHGSTVHDVEKVHHEPSYTEELPVVHEKLPVAH